MTIEITETSDGRKIYNIEKMSDDAKFISELKTLEAKATPGEWSAEFATIRHEDGRFRRHLAKHIRPDDAKFAAAAKTAVPRLIQMIEELSRDLANVEKYREETEIERDKIGNRLGDTRRELRASLEEVARLKSEL